MSLACKELPREIATEVGLEKEGDNRYTDLQDDFNDARTRKRVKPSKSVVSNGADEQVDTPLQQIASDVTSLTGNHALSGPSNNDRLQVAQAEEAIASAEEIRIKTLSGLTSNPDSDIAAKAKELLLSRLE